MTETIVHLPLQQTSSPPVTNEVLAYQIGQVQETLRQVLVELRAAATKEEVAEIRANVRVLQDDRVAARTILGVGSVLGAGGVAAIFKYFLLT